MSSRILITGANGQLGSELRVTAPTDRNIIYATRADLDLTDCHALDAYLKAHQITHVINCAAYTAVDMAEEEEESAYQTNAHAVANLAAQAVEKEITLIHVSTDFVFDGRAYEPYPETAATSPLSVYGKSKCDGERAVIENGVGVVIRTSWVFSSFGKNFVKTIRRLARERKQLGVIYDQVGAPTYAKDLARAIWILLPQITPHTKGIYHYTNSGVASWYDLAVGILEYDGIEECAVAPIRTEAYPTPAKRPSYSVLACEKIERVFGVSRPHWRLGLKECLSYLGEER